MTDPRAFPVNVLADVLDAPHAPRETPAPANTTTTRHCTACAVQWDHPHGSNVWADTHCWTCGAPGHLGGLRGGHPSPDAHRPAGDAGDAA